MQLGASIAVGDLGAGPAVMRDYAQAAEGLGFDYLVGARPCVRRRSGQDRSGPARLERHRLSRSRSCLFAFLAGVTKRSASPPAC
jgi:hypothetical protein